MAAWFGMNDIADAKASFAEQAVIFKRKHNWLMCWLYLGTFGSFIGFSAGFPLLIKGQFPDVEPAARSPFSARWSAPLPGPSAAGSRQARRRARHLLELRAMVLAWSR
jgi:nitrate/nitrite transporter NarK